MPRKFVELFVATIFFFVPVITFAQPIETKISADIVTAKTADLLVAEGNVTVQRGKVIVKADFLSFDRKTNNIKLTNLREFYDGKKIRLSASEAFSESLSMVLLIRPIYY